ASSFPSSDALDAGSAFCLEATTSASTFRSVVTFLVSVLPLGGSRPSSRLIADTKSLCSFQILAPIDGRYSCSNFTGSHASCERKCPHKSRGDRLAEFELKPTLEPQALLASPAARTVREQIRNRTNAVVCSRAGGRRKNFS